MNVTDDLDRLFPDHRSQEQSEAWEAVRARLRLGMPVSGTVVARYRFGVFVDIGVGFPALLEIVRMEGLPPERSRADDWHPIGSQVAAFVGGTGDRQIGIWQNWTDAFNWWV